MAMPHTIEVDGIRMPSRQINVGTSILDVPKCVARNNRNKCWQVKVIRKGETLLSGQFTDAEYGGAQKSLDMATKFLADSKLIESPKTLKLSARLSLFWGYVGADVFGLSASLYSAFTGKSQSIYLISQVKLNSGRIVGLQEKLAGVRVREWADVNGVQPKDAPVWVHTKAMSKAAEIMLSDEWKEFVNLGAELAAQKEAQRKSSETK